MRTSNIPVVDTTRQVDATDDPRPAPRGPPIGPTRGAGPSFLSEPSEPSKVGEILRYRIVPLRRLEHLRHVS